MRYDHRQMNLHEEGMPWSYCVDNTRDRPRMFARSEDWEKAHERLSGASGEEVLAAVRDGLEPPMQLCYSGKDAVRACADYVKANATDGFVPSIAPADNLKFCKCDDCGPQWAGKDGRALSAYVLGFANRVAAKAKKPLVTLAYWDYSRAPDMEIHPLVHVCFCRFGEFERYAYRPGDDGEVFAEMGKWRHLACTDKTSKTMGSNLLVRDFLGHYAWPGLFYVPRRRAYDAERYAELGIKTEKCVQEIHRRGAMQAPDIAVALAEIKGHGYVHPAIELLTLGCDGLADGVGNFWGRVEDWSYSIEGYLGDVRRVARAWNDNAWNDSLATWAALVGSPRVRAELSAAVAFTDAYCKAASGRLNREAPPYLYGSLWPWAETLNVMPPKPETTSTEIYRNDKEVDDR